MNTINIGWSDFKLFFIPRALSVQWEIRNNIYYLEVYDANIIGRTCQISITDPVNDDQLDFETNYKSNGNKSFTDIDGTMVIRTKAAKKGWTYQLLPIECTTSKLVSLFSKDVNGNSRSGITYKIYNSDNIEITESENESNGVKTIVDYEPLFDYEVIGGHIQQHTKPNSDIRVWVVAVPDIPAQYGGSKEMVGGVNLKYIDPADKITADGRATKLLAYNATYHTNKLRFIFKHDAGIQHDILIILEAYKA